MRPALGAFASIERANDETEGAMPTGHAAAIKVMSDSPPHPTLTRVVTLFSQETNNRVTLEFDPSPAVNRRIEGGGDERRPVPSTDLRGPGKRLVTTCRWPPPHSVSPPEFPRVPRPVHRPLSANEHCQGYQPIWRNWLSAA